MKLKLTEKGKDFLISCIEGGDSPKFTEIVLGNGENAGAEAVHISNQLVSVPINSIERENDFVKLSGTINNNDISNSFRVNELGVNIQDPSNAEEKILFAYGWDADDVAMLIPANTECIFETVENVMVYVGSAENVSAELSKSAVYVNRNEFDEHVLSFRNPHAVNAEQVGLGNVPNVATNDQTPTYSVATNLSTLISGEKLSVAFGKIMLAITTLVNHIANKSNPHGVTASQVNAASKIHNHSASDINSGTLGVARGGTGKNSFSQGQVLYASGAQTIEGTSNNKGSLYKSSSYSNPYFGTLPVDCGGTGKTELGGSLSSSLYRGIALQSSIPDSVPNGELVGVYVS